MCKLGSIEDVQSKDFVGSRLEKKSQEEVKELLCG